MAQHYSDNFAVAAPKDVDARRGIIADGVQVPFPSVAAALANPMLQPLARFLGMTALVFDQNGEMAEFWFKGGLENQHFILKSASNVIGMIKLLPSDLTDGKTYTSSDLKDKQFFLFRNGIQRYLSLEDDEYSVLPDGGFELTDAITTGDFIMLMGDSIDTGGGSEGNSFGYIVEHNGQIIV